MFNKETSRGFKQRTIVIVIGFNIVVSAENILFTMSALFHVSTINVTIGPIKCLYIANIIRTFERETQHESRSRAYIFTGSLHLSLKLSCKTFLKLSEA